MKRCMYCWGSHGCDLDENHPEDHECQAGHGDQPMKIRRGHPDVFHGRTDEPEVVL